MAFRLADVPDQGGRVAVVTGSNRGLGFEISRALAGRGAHVVMAARDRGRAEAARRLIAAEHGPVSTEIVDLDLADLSSVRTAAARILADHDSVDLLVCNAGIMGIPHRRTAQGFEMQFGVNHLGHFALTGLLWTALAAAGGARVVTITSFARHVRGRFDPDDPPLKGTYGPWKAYGQSKMANLRFAVELRRRARAAGVPVTARSCHPGFTHTGLQATSAREAGGRSQRFFEWAVRAAGMSQERGALVPIRAATDTSAGDDAFLGPRWYFYGAPVRRPLMPWTRWSEANRTLWEVSERLTGVRFPPAPSR